MNRIADAQRDCEAALELSCLVDRRTDPQGSSGKPQYLSLLGQVLDQQSRIHFLQRTVARGYEHAFAEAVEKLSRAIQLDPARAADKLRLEQIKARPAQSKRVNQSRCDDHNALPGAIRDDARGARPWDDAGAVACTSACAP